MQSAGMLNKIAIGERSDPRHIGMSFCVLVTLCLLPAAVFYFLSPLGKVSSGAPGTILVAVLAIFLPISGIVRPIPGYRVANYVSFAGLIVCAIIVHLVGSIAVGGGTEPGRAILSLPILLLMLAGGSALAAIFRQYSASLNRAIALMRWLLIGLTLLSIIGVRPLQGAWEKPVFPFSEPSHLALVLGPFIVHAFVHARGKSRILWVIGSLALAYFSKSLTLLVSVILASVICLPLSGIVLTVIPVLALAPFADLAYFSTRLDFDPGSQNLSNLVFRQGWELMSDALERTSGWGVGFQQLGYAPFRSPSADVIFSILKDDANTRDGGFLAAKIVSEFGFFGIFLVLAYLGVLTLAVLSLRKYASRRRIYPEHIILALCSICSFSVDMFVRDVGYFNTSILLALSSFYVFWESRRIIRE